MPPARNGSQNRTPTRRLRFDAYAARPVRGSEPRRTVSGRRFVVGAVLSILVLWGVLYLAFRDWRIRFRERAEFGRTRVAATVDRLADVRPPHADPDDWRKAVAETHAMLVTLTGSNVLGLQELKSLEAELSTRAARARPETVRAELAAVWDDMTSRAGPTIARHPRPKVLSDSTSRRGNGEKPGRSP